MKVAAAIREPYVRALGLVGMAHFMSHFYGMALPTLFPFLHQDLGGHCHINWAGRKVRWILTWPDAPALL